MWNWRVHRFPQPHSANVAKVLHFGDAFEIQKASLSAIFILGYKVNGGTMRTVYWYIWYNICTMWGEFKIVICMPAAIFSRVHREWHYSMQLVHTNCILSLTRSSQEQNVFVTDPVLQRSQQTWQRRPRGDTALTRKCNHTKAYVNCTTRCNQWS